jgi:hypothetical protein
VKPHGELVLSLTKDHPEQAKGNHIARAAALAIFRDRFGLRTFGSYSELDGIDLCYVVSLLADSPSLVRLREPTARSLRSRTFGCNELGS